MRAIARDHGDVVGLRLGPNRAILLNDPAAIHQVLVERADSFTKGDISPITKRLIGDALFAGEGPKHDRERRAVQPLLRHDRLGPFVANVARLSKDAASAWQRGSSIDAAREMADLSFRVMAANLFSFDTAEKAAPLRAALQHALSAFERTLQPLGRLLDRLPLPSTRRARKGAEELAALVDSEIAARRASPGVRGDLLDLLTSLRLEGVGADRLSDVETRHEAVDLIVASHETISVALAWALYELARHPDAQSKVATESAAILGERAATLADVPALTTARGAFQEALRLHPPAWAFLRRAKESLALNGYRVDSGNLVILAPCVTQMDPRFFPEPMAFDISRFGPEAHGSRPKSSYFPFGAGQRSCIGEPLALAEGSIVLATLLRRLRFVPIGGEVQARARVTLLPAGPIPLRVEARGEGASAEG